MVTFAIAVEIEISAAEIEIGKQCYWATKL